jgi:hypothetical protein
MQQPKIKQASSETAMKKNIPLNSFYFISTFIIKIYRETHHHYNEQSYFEQFSPK